MPQVSITETPRRLADLLGIDPADLITFSRAELGGWLAENTGPGVLFYRRSTTQPDPAAAIGARLNRGAREQFVEYSGGAYGGPWWLWSTRVGATLIIEETAIVF